MISITPWMLLALSLLMALPAGAQPLAGRLGHGPPAFMRQLFPPELVMQHRHEIGLEAAQQEAITKAIQATQAEVLEIQWEVEDEQRKLEDLIAAAEVDEEAALEQAQRLMGMEQKVKLSHLGLLIRIRNQLTQSQRRQLEELRPEDTRPYGRGRGRGLRP
jgi:Spy/CpxP family protein refolding chaperone